MVVANEFLSNEPNHLNAHYCIQSCCRNITCLFSLIYIHFQMKILPNLVTVDSGRASFPFYGGI